MKGSAPNKAEKKYWSDLADNVGCIACYKEAGIYNGYVSIHHIAGRTKPGAHMLVLPLCSSHHQDDGSGVIAVHPYKARFERMYGPQMRLKEECDEMLKAAGKL